VVRRRWSGWSRPGPRGGLAAAEPRGPAGGADDCRRATPLGHVPPRLLRAPARADRRGSM